MQININYDSSVSNAPAGFQQAVQAAVQEIERSLTTDITVNITFGWGTVGGQPIDAGAVGESLSNAYDLTYAALRQDLASAANGMDNVTALAALGPTDPTHGGVFSVSTAEAKALGITDPHGNGVDGYVGLDATSAFSWDPNNRAQPGLYDAVGALEHEITEVLGRTADAGAVQSDGSQLYGALDLFRFSAPGVHAVSGAGSFSTDGQTLLQAFNDPSNGGDAGDWAQGVTGDTFDAFANTGEQLSLSSADLKVMNLLGYQLAHSTLSVPIPGVAASQPQTVSSDTTVAQGQTIYITDAQDEHAFEMTDSGYDTGNGPSFTNNGTVIASAGADTVYSIAGIDCSGGGPFKGSFFTNGSTGAFYVDGGSYTGARGFTGISWTASFTNEGIFQVTGAELVVGAESYGANPSIGNVLFQFDNTSSGTFIVSTANGTATGVDMHNGGNFTNAGLIDVSGNWSASNSPQVIGIENATTFNNTGTIRVENLASAGSSAAVVIGVHAGTVYNNSGLIQGKDAFWVDAASQSPPFRLDMTLNNSGTIIGAIDLGTSWAQIHNTGTIAGDIFLGSGDSLYDGANGHFYGSLYLGYGNNVVTLGNDPGIVYGGGGSDSITGGAGDDFIEISRGTNAVDGGGGFNTLSFQSSDATVSVDLGAGVATAGGTDAVKNIQCVIASDFTSTLKAGAQAAELVGGAAADTLIGGTGNDTLIAGTGGGVMTGSGGDNTFVYATGDHQLTITDFLANGDQDILKIYGYAAALSVQQEGADTLITLSATDSILLKNTVAAALTSANVVYNAGGEPALDVPSSVPVYGTTPIEVNNALTIGAGETLDEVNQRAAFYLSDNGIYYTSAGLQWPDSKPTVDNFGTVIVSDALGALGAIVDLAPQSGAVTNEAGASFTVSSSGNDATGLFVPASGVQLSNAGSFTVTGTTAALLKTWDLHTHFTNASTGVVTVTATSGEATGINFNNGGTVQNAGVINVTGVGLAYGLNLMGFESLYANGVADSVTNSGTITATATGPGAKSYGIAISGSLGVASNMVWILNTGTITAQTAIYDYVPAGVSESYVNVNITNKGTINGDVDLGGDSPNSVFTFGDGSESTFTNTGTVNGNVLVFGGRAPVIDLRGGVLNGQIIYTPLGDPAYTDNVTIYTGSGVTPIVIHEGRPHSTVNVFGGAGGMTTVALDMSATAATKVHNSDGSWTIQYGVGTENLSNVAQVQFADRTVTLANLKAVSTDFEGDGISDVLFVGPAGLTAWRMSNIQVLSQGLIGSPSTGATYLGSGDFNGDNQADLLFRKSDGTLATWQMSGTTISGGGTLGNPGAAWSYVGSGDFNGDGRSDVLFRNANGMLASWDLNGTATIGGGNIGNPGAGWTFKAVGDFNGDGKSDLLFENAAGLYAIWTLNDTQITASGNAGNPGPGWFFKGVGDFNGDGSSDLLFENASGTYASWDLNGTHISGGGTIGNPGAAWSLVGIGDYNGDGKSDLLFENAQTGQYATWDLNDAAISGGGTIGTAAGYTIAEAPKAWVPPVVLFSDANGNIASWEVSGSSVIGGGNLGNPGAGWSLKATGDLLGTGGTDLIFQRADGTVATWQTNGSTLVGGATLGSPGSAWSVVGAADFNGDGKSDILFHNTATGMYATWDVSGGHIIGGGNIGNPGAGWTFEAAGDFNGDGKADMLFLNSTGMLAIWELSDTKIIGGGNVGNPGSGWTFKGIGDFNGDGRSDMLFENASGTYATWDLNGTQITGGGTIGNPGSGWTLVKIADLNGDGKSDLIFENASGAYATWTLNDTHITGGATLGNPGASWHFLG